MTVGSIKTHYSLIPLYGVMGVAMAVVVAYVWRLATLTTDINWSKKEEPYNYYRDKRFQLLSSPGTRELDFNTACKAPNYKD